MAEKKRQKWMRDKGKNLFFFDKLIQVTWRFYS